MSQSLQERWANATPEQAQDLGAVLWQDLLQSKVGQLVSRELVDEVLSFALCAEVAEEVWKQLPLNVIEKELTRLAGSDLLLSDMVGEDGVGRLRRLVARPRTPNRELASRLLDQPLMRQALRESLKGGLQQFVSQLGDNLPFGKSKVGPTGGMGRGVVGELGRGLGRGFARRAKETAQIGKTWFEGMGVGKTFEDQIQPFLASYANRAVAGLIEDLFSGERAELAMEARVNALNILLETPLAELLDEPDLSLIDLRLKLAASIAAHNAKQPEVIALWREAAGSIWDNVCQEQVSDYLTRLNLGVEAPEALLQQLGWAAFGALSRSHFQTWLMGELGAVQGQ